MLVDLRNKGLTGKEAEKKLDQVGITVNKNTIPNDPQKPFITMELESVLPLLLVEVWAKKRWLKSLERFRWRYLIRKNKRRKLYKSCVVSFLCIQVG